MEGPLFSGLCWAGGCVGDQGGHRVQGLKEESKKQIANYIRAMSAVMGKHRAPNQTWVGTHEE